MATFETKLTGGTSNFSVILQDEAGNNRDLLVNIIGEYEGTTFALIPNDGPYYLNIRADGRWELFTKHLF
ncbi:hypothetical protein GLW08_10445 [Pontibacillus yanchengensis]|uniref:Uncharacterized protein n=1 Tax=Pontibacillus yanchengensis TaxID=462910 RepID=A0ACC7VI11_9BACI|nr:hypothetical protein [Pontibacillus yanchengensis]MYL53755.1 hypothetical protein [Pontibacillus yanchengensis]